MSELYPGEEVVTRTRRHWLVLFGQLFPLALVGGFAWYFSRLLISQEVPTPAGILSIPGLPEDLIVAGLATILLLLLIQAMYIWTDYFLDVWIITDRRVIGIEQHGLFTREIHSFQLNRIQNIRTDVSGILPTVFNFGTVHIETAGTDQDIVMGYVPRPKHVRETLMQLSGSDPQAYLR